MQIAAVNSLEQASFVDRFGGVFEHSPWVAERAWARRPFASADALFRAMHAAVLDAERAEQLALVRAHPELAGREAVAGTMTDHSFGEQGRLGFLALPSEEVARIVELNRRYREKFGFPCIVALALHGTRASVLAEMERRLGGDAETELGRALEQIGHIARRRLEAMFGSSREPGAGARVPPGSG